LTAAVCASLELLDLFLQRLARVLDAPDLSLHGYSLGVHKD